MKKLEWKYCFCLTLIYLWVQIQADKEKRQIFREQVLPALGGKIPEEAFRTDRLALNHLNKEGITISDGVVLEARHPQVKHSNHRQSSTNDVLKVYLTRDDKYVSPEGHYHYNHPKAVDTTYVIRKPIGHGSRQKPTDIYHGFKSYVFNKPQAFSSYQKNAPLTPTKPGIYKPIISPIILPSTNDFVKKSHYPSWTFIYDWDTYYERLSDYYNNIAFINSQQIITDYGNFLNDFHHRSQRHVSQTTDDQNASRADVEKSNTLLLSKKDLSYKENFNYPNLKFIPQAKVSRSE